MKKLFFLLFFVISFCFGQTTEFRASPVPKTTSTFDLGQSWLVWDSLYINYLINTNPLLIARGGTGQATAMAAFDALSPVTTLGDMIYRDASNNVRLAIGTVGKIIRSTGTAPAWTVSLSEDVNGKITVDDTLIVTNHLKQSGGSVWFDGTMGATPTSGAGTRLMWIPSKKALRAGSVTGVKWDADSIGSNSFAFGSDNLVRNTYSSILGGAENTISQTPAQTGQFNAILSGGSNNITNSDYSNVLGGSLNSITFGNFSSVLGGESNTIARAGFLVQYSSVFGKLNTVLGNDSYVFGVRQRSTQPTTVLFGYGNAADTLNYGHGFFIRNIPFIVMAKDTSWSGLSGTGHGKAHIGLFHERTSDTTAYFLSMQRSPTAYNTGDFVIEKTWGARSAAINIPKSLEFMRFLGSDNTLHFNYAKDASASYGNIFIDNGNLNIASLTASRLAVSDASKNLASTITLANFASSVSDATGTTGTGKFVMDGTPTLVTPNIGAATGISVNLTGTGTFGNVVRVNMDRGYESRSTSGTKIWDFGANSGEDFRIIQQGVVTPVIIAHTTGAITLLDVTAGAGTFGASDFTSIHTLKGDTRFDLGGFASLPAVRFLQTSDNPTMRFYRPTGGSPNSYVWQTWVDGNTYKLSYAQVDRYSETTFTDLLSLSPTGSLTVTGAVTVARTSSGVAEQLGWNSADNVNTLVFQMSHGNGVMPNANSAYLSYTTNAAGFGIRTKLSGAANFQIDNNGNVTVTGTGSLYIADTIKAGPTGGGTPYSYFIPGGALVQSSTQDVKKNIRPYIADLSKFSIVKPKKYNFKRDLFFKAFDESTLPDSLSEAEKGEIRAKFRADNIKEMDEKSRREMTGFLAEEFNAIIGKDSKEINQQDVINVLWLKVQELEARVKKLEK